MTRNVLFIVIGVLVIVTACASYFYYQERQSGIDIKIDGSGVTIDGN